MMGTVGLGLGLSYVDFDLATALIFNVNLPDTV